MPNLSVRDVFDKVEVKHVSIETDLSRSVVACQRTDLSEPITTPAYPFLIVW